MTVNLAAIGDLERERDTSLRQLKELEDILERMETKKQGLKNELNTLKKSGWRWFLFYLL